MTALSSRASHHGYTTIGDSTRAFTTHGYGDVDLDMVRHAIDPELLATALDKIRTSITTANPS